ncbi:GntR family transcriptional regulator [Corynebacterium bouchesdurhonense]|uniref:GntR family transcriptional regulator n=1 Tax=Corynebacterium bouchesdurhonense TaxID=1720192 RepID=UPI000830BDE9|nr:winged helix-turn-helix domain-containing protein [Corynebacterium bouchesdurhonense]
MLFDVSRSNPQPLPAQIAASVRAAIASGVLAPGDELPSTRAAAQQAGVSRGTVVAAYDQLAGEGYLLLAQGAPTRVHPQLRVAAAAAGVGGGGGPA